MGALTPEAGWAGTATGAEARAGLFDRARGALLGLAVGDALGTPLEFSASDILPHHAEVTGDGPFPLRPGQWPAWVW